MSQPHFRAAARGVHPDAFRVSVASSPSCAALLVASLGIAGAVAAEPMAEPPPEPPARQAQQEPTGGLAGFPGLENIELRSDSIAIEGTTFTLIGDVDLSDSEHGVRLLADELSFDTDTKIFAATGNVSFEQKELLLNGSSMEGDLDDQTLTMLDMVGIAQGPAGDFYLRAERVEQLEPGKFRLHKGRVTPCNQTSAIWEFRARTMVFQPGHHVSMSLPNVRVKGIPIIGLPYLYWPLQDTHRQTGLLLPSIGVSNLRGFMVSQTFFTTLGRSADVSLTYERFASAGNAYAAEFRHSLSEGSNGYVRLYHLSGRQVTPEEEALGERSFASGWSVRGQHLQVLPGGFALRARADFLTSTEFARGIRDDVSRFLQRDSIVSANILKSWGSSTLTVVVDQRESFFTNTRSNIGRRLPEIDYQLRSTQVAGPVYVGLATSVDRFEKFVRDDSTDTQIGGSYGRFNVSPDVVVALTQIPWLTFKPFARLRSTYYTNTADKDGTLLEETAFRQSFQTGVELVGPSFFTIVETPGMEYSPRFKHLIQPRLTYRRVRPVGQLDIEGRIIDFDDIDSRVRDQQQLVAELTTRLFAKRFNSPRDDERQVWEVGEITVARTFDLDPLSDESLEAIGAPRILLPYTMRFRLRPSARVALDSQFDFTPGLQPANIRVGATLNGEKDRLRVGWSRRSFALRDPFDLTQVLIEPSSSTIEANGQVDLFGQHLTLGGQLQMDLTADELRTAGGSLAWNLQCCSLGVNFRRFNFADRLENQFTFLLNLAQVGKDIGFETQRR